MIPLTMMKLSDYESFWARQARDLISGMKISIQPWWELPFENGLSEGTKYFLQLFRRHVEAGYGDRIAYFWEGEPGDTEKLHIRIFLWKFQNSRMF